jgi:uncharacterized protein YecE (DUF72 family)
LDGPRFERFFIKRLEPYRDRVGPLIIEFGTFNRATFPKPADFLARLDLFLASLPAGFRYAVEIRNPDYLGDDYLAVLSSHNVAHVVSAWTRMPEMKDQIAAGGDNSADFVVARALVARHRAYDSSVQAFEPYDRIQEPNPGVRDAMKTLIGNARGRKKPAFLFVNNRLEGNAASTIEAVVDSLPS